MMLDITIREITSADYSQLEDFLYHAIFIPAGEEYPPREIIFQPEIYVYIKDFGLDTDCGVVAECDNKIIGAAWTRIIPAYGHPGCMGEQSARRTTSLDESIPELAISILPDYRGQGIGTLLMNRLFELLRERGYKRTSLSVQQNNPAVRFYKRLGYSVTDEKVDHAGHEDFIMVKYLLFHDIKLRITEPEVGIIISYAAVDSSQEGIVNEVKKYLSSDRLHFYGWVENGNIVGVCGFEVHADKVEIHLIAVAEDRQKQGIGGAMVAALQEIYRLPLEAETVEEAVGFYLKKGFETTSFQHPEGGVKYTCMLGTKAT